MKIKDILQQRDHGVSFEFFPPKTEKGMENLLDAAVNLKQFDPMYFSVTYGAGGTSQERTKETVDLLRGRTGVEVMPHLTCVGASKHALTVQLDTYFREGCDNILALRGDLPESMDDRHLSDDFTFAKDLVVFLRRKYDLSVGVALCPEGHMASKTLIEDVGHMAEKIKAGADFVITQMFFDNSYLYDYVEKLRCLDIELPVIPGIIPVTDLDKIQKFAELSGATIPDHILVSLNAVADDPQKVRMLGINYAIEQCQDLIDNGFRFLHFFALNRAEDASDIIKELTF